MTATEHLARFEVVRIRRGSVVEAFRPSLELEQRESVRYLITEMKRDARRWGDTIAVRRITRFYNLED